ncbi:GNAT family N-acetyltransferase [Methylobacterium oryzisoli]|uniref:GNAT family N-acetyltransferase n=1 Tax=Methylobacterium oryzisoli TaxID=3385502 RepID=UPI00389261F4
MSDAPFVVEALGTQDRSAFRSGVDALDRYFHTQVTQDVRRRVTACFVGLDRGTGVIAGYYTLSASDVVLAEVPADLARKLPRYPAVPVALLGRLAIDRTFRGWKLGAALLVNAAARAARSDIAVFGLVVDAKDDRTEAFYRHFGFRPFGTRPRRLIAAIDTFRALLGPAR